VRAFTVRGSLVLALDGTEIFLGAASWVSGWTVGDLLNRMMSRCDDYCAKYKVRQRLLAIAAQKQREVA